jgi:hypothetical protein
MELPLSGAIGFLAGRDYLFRVSLIRMKRPWDAIAWWEIRRIPFNLFMLVIGLLSGFTSMFAASHLPKSDADFGSPILGAIFYGLAANVCYTLGWITELLWAWGDTTQTEKMRPRVFHAGLVFSAGLTFLPAIIFLLTWAGHSLR